MKRTHKYKNTKKKIQQQKQEKHEGLPSFWDSVTIHLSWRENIPSLPDDWYKFIRIYQWFEGIGGLVGWQGVGLWGGRGGGRGYIPSLCATGRCKVVRGALFSDSGDGLPEEGHYLQRTNQHKNKVQLWETREKGNLIILQKKSIHREKSFLNLTMETWEGGEFSKGGGTLYTLIKHQWEIYFFLAKDTQTESILFWHFQESCSIMNLLRNNVFLIWKYLIGGCLQFFPHMKDNG